MIWYHPSMLHCHLVHSSTSLCLFCSLCLSLRVDLCMFDLSSFYRCSDVFWTWLRVHTYVPAKKIYMGNRWEPSSQRHKNYHSAQTSTQGSSKKTSGIHGKIKLFWNNSILRECYKSTKRDESSPSSQRVQHSHHEAREIDRRNQPFTKKNDMFW